MPACSVSNDILLTGNVAFIILQMSDFSRLPLDVYVFTRYGYNIKKIQTQRGHHKAMVMFHFLKINEIEKILCLFDSKTWGLCQERIKFTRFILGWHYMSDFRIGVDLLLWSILGWISCCYYMAAQSALNQQF